MVALTVASAQFDMRAEPSLAAFLTHMEGLVRTASERGASAILFPELASTGLLGAIEDHEVTSATITADYWERLPEHTDAIVDGLVSMARAHKIVIIGGSHNRLSDDGSLRNTAYVVHPDGRVETQDKIHLTPQEHALGARGGDELLVTKIGPFTAGVLICADIQFPELARHLVRQGVDLIFCPSLTWNRRGVCPTTSPTHIWVGAAGRCSGSSSVAGSGAAMRACTAALSLVEAVSQVSTRR